MKKSISPFFALLLAAVLAVGPLQGQAPARLARDATPPPLGVLKSPAVSFEAARRALPVNAVALLKAPNVQASPAASSAQEPHVSVIKTPQGEKVHSGSKAKWIILAVVAAGAGLGVAMATGKKSSSPASQPGPSISIGAPTISVGQQQP